jgi:AraC family ethanolamine operon transcriptional activator
VRRAREFILDNICEPIPINVCYELGISRRALQYSFEDVLNINPGTYLLLLRLNGARRDLINARWKPVQVKDVVERRRFWHLSRFSAQLRQIFNELPSQILQLARWQAEEGGL